MLACAEYNCSQLLHLLLVKILLLLLPFVPLAQILIHVSDFFLREIHVSDFTTIYLDYYYLQLLTQTQLPVTKRVPLV
jgi:hypothetical protein